jgi:hypothetical protein
MAMGLMGEHEVKVSAAAKIMLIRSRMGRRFFVVDPLRQVAKQPIPGDLRLADAQATDFQRQSVVCASG